LANHAAAFFRASAQVNASLMFGTARHKRTLSSPAGSSGELGRYAASNACVAATGRLEFAS